MSNVETRPVATDEGEMRLDRWFKLHYPNITHAYLNKLLRTGQVRVDGGRVKASARLHAGQKVRVPPLTFETRPADAPRTAEPLSPEDRTYFQSLVIFEDKDLFVINKPPGIAVQGGTRTVRHIDRLLDQMGTELGERPRLVHRLDKDTSGVLVIAKRRAIAAALGRAFATRSVRKVYWALVIGIPKPAQGKIATPLVKTAGPEGDRVRAAEPGEQDLAQHATTHYALVDRAGQKTSWVSLKPVTGRQHQLRAHMAIIGHPILGDTKYHGDNDLPAGIESKLHLHARRIAFTHPRGGKVDVTAPLPDHMRKSFALFGFDADKYDHLAEEVEEG